MVEWSGWKEIFCLSRASCAACIKSTLSVKWFFKLTSCAVLMKCDLRLSEKAGRIDMLPSTNMAFDWTRVFCTSPSCTFCSPSPTERTTASKCCFYVSSLRAASISLRDFSAPPTRASDSAEKILNGDTKVLPIISTSQWEHEMRRIAHLHRRVHYSNPAWRE